MKITRNGEEMSVRFAEPNQAQIFELDKFFRKIFSECIREGIMTEAEAKKRFEQSGAWTDADETEIQGLIQSMGIASALLGNLEEVNEEANNLIEKIQADRTRMFELISRKTELMANTAEGMANEQKIFKYILLCLVEESGTQVFSSQSDLEEFAQDGQDEFSVIVTNAYSLVYGIDSEKDITQDWAEVQFMNKISASEDSAAE